MTHTFVVDRNHPDLFTYMRAHFADVPEVGVMLDRRRGDRRRQMSAGAADRRRMDRRTGPASTWTTLGFVTVSASPQATPEHATA